MKFFTIIFNIIKLLDLYLFRRLHIIILAFFFSIKIKKIVNSDIKNISIVFDFQSTPPTYGEFVYYLVLAKYFKLKRKKVEIILISNFNKKSLFRIIDKKKIFLFKEEIKKLTSFYMKINLVEYKSFNNFIKDYQNKKKNILFNFFISRRISIYQTYLPLLNYILQNEKKNFINKLKFTKDKNLKIKNLEKIKPYIAWHIRKNKSWGNYNNNNNEIIKIANYLNSQKRNYKILILSDRNGCIWARKILKNFKNIYYSDKLANGFTEAAKALINSNYYFQFKGGGLTTIAYFSNIPYKIISYITPHDKKFSNRKFLSWQLDNQFRVYNYKKINITEAIKEDL